MSANKITYITYNAGVDWKNLHLGNLVHDFQNPSFYDPHIEKAYTDIGDFPPDWASLTSIDNYALTLGRGAEQGHNATQLAEATVQRYRVAAAEKTTKLEITDPEEFFEEITLASPSAKKWLASHLSAAEALAKGKSDARPEIWMLTGLVLMQHATWTSLSCKDDAGFVAGKRAPFGPSEVSHIRRLSISENVKPTFGFRAEGEGFQRVEGATIHETGKYPGTRAWAAQWQKIEFQVGGKEKWKEGVKELVKLKDGVAIVRINEDIFAGDGSNGKESAKELFDDLYWNAFMDAIDE
ncbi:hypothetical protein PZA11_000180 [Diplocarpon coronariae]